MCENVNDDVAVHFARTSNRAARSQPGPRGRVLRTTRPARSPPLRPSRNPIRVDERMTRRSVSYVAKPSEPSTLTTTAIITTVTTTTAERRPLKPKSLKRRKMRRRWSRRRMDALATVPATIITIIIIIGVTMTTTTGGRTSFSRRTTTTTTAEEASERGSGPGRGTRTEAETLGWATRTRIYTSFCSDFVINV